MTTVEARYAGNCPRCWEPWKPGDAIYLPPSGEAWIHAECPDPLPATLDHAAVCPSCFHLRSTGGKCWCT